MKKSDYQKWRDKADKIAAQVYDRAAELRWPYGNSAYSFFYLAQAVVCGASREQRHEELRQQLGHWPNDEDFYGTSEIRTAITDELTEMLSANRAQIARKVWTINQYDVGRPPFQVYVEFKPTLPDEFDGRRGHRTLSGWTFSDLRQSVWVNVWTGNISILGGICFDTWLKPHLVRQKQSYGGWLDHLGVWREKQYCIDNDVRIDHLPPITRSAWLRWAVNKSFTKSGERHSNVLETAQRLGLGDYDVIAAQNAALLQSDKPAQLRLL